uniref:TetR/AcrR family transcriptional regulator C-terminal domain-containing protein n=1 Tax=Roseburia sp. TaxID=2049040 RepID=UPI003FF0620A
MTGQGKRSIDLLLAESFKELAVKQPIEKITIKEITDKAGVIRPTFYNHFQDKYELLEWIIKAQLLDPIEPLVQNGMVNEALTLLFTNIEKEKEFYSRAVRLEGQNSFGVITQKCVEELLLKVIRKAETGKKGRYAWLTPERIAEYYAQSMCYVTITWIRSGMTASARELTEIYQYIIKRSMEDVIQEL